MTDIVERLTNYGLCLDANVVICDRRVVDGAAEEIRTLRTRLSQWEKVAEEMAGALGELVESVDNLITDSDGVYGLHLNGDPAPWGELTQGGRFEEWLIALESARPALTTYRNLKGQSDGD